jgi:hypothetical protein
MKENEDFYIADYDYIGSAIGNAYYSGLSFEQLWNCVRISSNREQLDDAVSVTILLNQLVKKENTYYE